MVPLYLRLNELRKREPPSNETTCAGDRRRDLQLLTDLPNMSRHLDGSSRQRELGQQLGQDSIGTFRCEFAPDGVVSASTKRLDPTGRV